MVQASMHMEMSGTYIYDGWLPIESTDKAEIDKRLEDLRESLASFALISGGSFNWEPKYSFARNKTTSYFLEDDDLDTRRYGPDTGRDSFQRQTCHYAKCFLGIKSTSSSR